MASAQPLEDNAKQGDVRGAAAAAPRANPLTIVTAAVAGDDLQSVAHSAADALGEPVAIALPAIGPAVQWPPAAAPSPTLQAVREYAAGLISGTAPALPESIFQAVPVRLGDQVLGVVAALTAVGAAPEHRPWLEAAAAAAAVTALMRGGPELEPASAGRALLQMLELHSPENTAGLLAQARRLGCDLDHGAIGLCAALSAGGDPLELRAAGALVADVGGDRLLGLVPLRQGEPAGLGAVVGALERAGVPVAVSAPRGDPADLRDALREAGVLLELLIDPGAMFAAQEETYRLLTGILLRDPGELERLRALTISQLESYDTGHETELLATLEAFLAHHGSTTETAEAMSLHRHTVGYRLARVQEVSSLSPYESDGRERLSLGLKASRIIEAEARRIARSRTGA